MTILVDEPREYETKLRYKWWSHMVSDVGPDELHAFAKQLGLKRSWSQTRPHHYDITPPVRERAIALGAIAVSARGLVRRNYDGLTCRRERGELPPRIGP